MAFIRSCMLPCKEGAVRGRERQNMDFTFLTILNSCACMCHLLSCRAVETLNCYNSYIDLGLEIKCEYLLALEKVCLAPLRISFLPEPMEIGFF